MSVVIVRRVTGERVAHWRDRVRSKGKMNRERDEECRQDVGVPGV